MHYDILGSIKFQRSQLPSEICQIEIWKIARDFNVKPDSLSRQRSVKVLPDLFDPYLVRSVRWNVSHDRVHLDP